MVATARADRLIQQPFFAAGVIPPLPVAIFGEDRRQPVWDLLRRDPGSLTAEERAIVQAAGRIGTMACGNTGTNGTLIQLAGGRDAVLTSAHSFIDDFGQVLCDLSTARFMPNVSFHPGGAFEDSTLRLVQTAGEVLNADNRDFLPTIMAMNGGMGEEIDFLIFPLAETISTDRLPDGNTRGYMRMAAGIPLEGIAILIGINTAFFNGETPGYDACNYRNATPEFFHLCATSESTSSSPLMLLVEGELLLAGMHVAAYTRYGDRVVPVPSDLADGNIAVSIDTIRAYLDSIGVPAVTAPAVPAGQPDVVKPGDVAPAAAEVEL